MSSQGKVTSARSSLSPAEVRTERLELYAARSLDFDEVVRVFERYALTSLGLRALRTLSPFDDDETRLARSRAEDMRLLQRASDLPVLSGVADPVPALEHAHRAGRALEDENLMLVRAFLDASVRLFEWLAARARDVPALGALSIGAPDFVPLLEKIDEAVDERGRVRDQASPLLWRLRKEGAEIAAAIDKTLRALIARPEIKVVLSDPNPVRRGGRPVLAVKVKSQGRVAGIVHDRSQTGESVFVEPREVVAAGNRYAEIEADERREVERVLLELTRAILAREEAIVEAAERLAKLEIALIGARYAVENDARVPEIATEAVPGERVQSGRSQAEKSRTAQPHADKTRSDKNVSAKTGSTPPQPASNQAASPKAAAPQAASNQAAPTQAASSQAEKPGEKGPRRGLLLRAARHPLLVEQVRLGRLASVTPIDLRLGADFDLMIITGPNTGGKTLALKTAGLAALLTRCGLPFPCAEGSTIPLYDGVVADIGDEQEISQSLSTFSSHLVRIKAGLLRATSKTLVLLDELGGGTDPDEGAALSEAILEALQEKRAPTIVSTHIGKLKEFAFRHGRAENACVEFDPRSLSPRYKLLVGTPGESGALVIARRLGLPHKLVDRAQQRLVKRDAETQKLMADMRTARMQAEKLRGEVEVRLEDADRATRAIEQKQIEIDRRGEMLEAEAQRSIEDRVRAARAALARARPLLEQLPAPAKKTLGEAIEQVEAELSGAALSDRRQTFLDSLTKGSFVYLPRYRQRVPVQKVDHEKRELRVLMGAMSMKVSFDDVTSYEAR